MKSAFVNNTLNYLIKNNACTQKQVKVFKYTLESLYSFFTKTTVILLLSIFFKTFSITLIMILMYSLLRGFAFGIHASKNAYCWIISLIVYIVLPLLIKYYTISNIYITISFIIGLSAILLWAPADTPSRPLLNKNKRSANKFIATLLVLIYIISSISIQNYNFREIVASLLIIEAICVCPLTYKIFHVPFKNYKNYK